MGLLTATTVKKFEFHKYKMADGRHFDNRKIVVEFLTHPYDVLSSCFIIILEWFLSVCVIFINLILLNRPSVL